MSNTIEVPINLIKAIFAWGMCPANGSYDPDQYGAPSIEDTCENLANEICSLTGIDCYSEDDLPITYGEMLELFNHFIERHQQKSNPKNDSQQKITEMFSG